jgi:Domain of unknown function (DUF4424)
MSRMLLGLVFAILLAISPARANDSTVELANGGLVFVKNDKIEMRSEDLSVSAEQIRVRYQFFNKSDQDVTVHVAFPLPDLIYAEFDISMPSSFVTSVNGRPITANIEQKVFAKGVDHTSLLRKLNVPLDAYDRATEGALLRVPQKDWATLIDAGLAEIEELHDGKKSLAPRWTLKTTYYWEQVFPAKAETIIEHRYQPSVGGTVETSLGDASAMKEEWFPQYQKKYCLDQQFLAATERASKAAKARGESSIRYSEHRIDYILKTGANWAGPIKDFRLVISKGDADSLISFCGEGVKKISPTEFEMRKTDFTPREDLHLLILKKFGE